MVQMISLVVARSAVLVGIVLGPDRRGEPRWKASSGGWEGGRVIV